MPSRVILCQWQPSIRMAPRKPSHGDRSIWQCVLKGRKRATAAGEPARGPAEAAKPLDPAG